jgi:hypothetical protein
MEQRELMRDFNKVFAIGRNKTGTTSLQMALGEMGLTVGAQRGAEVLVDDWLVRDFHRLIEYCRGAEAYQDIPFSLNYTYIAMDLAFPGSKFILSVREPEQWYRSLLRFHFSAVGYKMDAAQFTRADEELITKIKEWSYVRKRWAYDVMMDTYALNDASQLYDPAIFKANFEQYNAEVRGYFRHRPHDLLVLDVSAERGTDRIAEFLGVAPSPLSAMPHENKGRADA